MAQIDSNRAAMGRYLIDIKQDESVRCENFLNRNEREVREVLVINRIVLVLAHQLHDMREFERRYSSRLEHDSNAAHEVVNIRHLCQDVVPDYQIRHLTVRDHLQGGLASEKLNESG